MKQTKNGYKRRAEENKRIAVRWALQEVQLDQTLPQQLKLEATSTLQTLLAQFMGGVK